MLVICSAKNRRYISVSDDDAQSMYCFLRLQYACIYVVILLQEQHLPLRLNTSAGQPGRAIYILRSRMTTMHVNYVCSTCTEMNSLSGCGSKKDKPAEAHQGRCSRRFPVSGRRGSAASRPMCGSTHRRRTR